MLLEAIKKEMDDEVYRYYVGTSYRHLMIWDKGEVAELTPPHDIKGVLPPISAMGSSAIPSPKTTMYFMLKPPCLSFKAILQC